MKRFLTTIPPYCFSATVIVAVIYLTLFPDPLPETDMPFIEGMDKVVHGIMMFGVITSLSFDYIRHKRLSVKMPLGRLLVFLAFTVVFGAVIEVAQEMMALGRGGDMYDFVADCIGAIFGMAVARVWMTRIVAWLLS